MMRAFTFVIIQLSQLRLTNTSRTLHIRTLLYLSSLSAYHLIVFIMTSNINPHTGKPFSAAYRGIRARAQALPVVQQMDRLLDAIDNHQVTIIMGDTGTGKSTQTPQYALERFSGFLEGKFIGITQPRRLAAHEACRFSTIQSSYTSNRLEAEAKQA
jgi:hypothetical protein